MFVKNKIHIFFMFYLKLREKLEKRLKKIREALGKTQKEMSALLGLGEITWQNYERGISKPKLGVLQQLAKLGYDISWITTGIGEMSANVSENNETSATFNGDQSSVDRAKIFKLVLSELENIYTKEELLNQPKDFLPLRAFDIAMNISNLADCDATALNMIKLMIISEQNKKS